MIGLSRRVQMDSSFRPICCFAYLFEFLNLLFWVLKSFDGCREAPASGGHDNKGVSYTVIIILAIREVFIRDVNGPDWASVRDNPSPTR